MIESAAAQRETLDGRRRKTSDRLASGWFETSRCSSWLHAASTARSGFRQPDTLERFDLGRGNEENQMPFWRLRTSGSLAAGRNVYRGSRHPRAAARSAGRFADERAQFTTRVNPSTAPVFVRNRVAVSDIALVSITVPVIIATGFGSRSPSRRSGGCLRRGGTRGRFGLARAHSTGRLTPRQTV